MQDLRRLYVVAVVRDMMWRLRCLMLEMALAS